MAAGQIYNVSGLESLLLFLSLWKGDRFWQCLPGREEAILCAC